MARDDRPGGPSEHRVPARYADLPTTVLAWRLRLWSSAVTVAFLMAGESVGALFLATFALFVLLMAAGSVLGRFEVRYRAFRTERRR